MNTQQDLGVETLQLILDSMQSMVYVTEAETYNVIFANKAVKSMFGEVEGKPCYQISKPRTGPCSFCRLKEVLTRPIGDPLVWNDSDLVQNLCININQTIVKWPDGRKAHIAILTDTTGSRENELELTRYKEELEAALNQSTEREQMLQSMSDNLPNTFVFQLRETTENPVASIVFMSARVESICGVSPEQLGSNIMPLLSMFYPEDLSRLLELAGKNASFGIEARLNVPGREETTWLYFSEIPRPGREPGELIWDGIAVDITARKKMEEELRASQEQLLSNAILMKEISGNLVSSGLYRTCVNKEGKIRLEYASSQLEQITGVSIEAMQEDLNLFFNNFHPEDREAALAQISKLVSGTEEGSVEFRYLLHGETRWYRLTSRGMLRKGGQIARDGMLTDITAQKELELELIAARDQAQESEMLKSRFLANMSHEIRTPMNAIIGFLEVLSTDDDIDRETQVEYMRIVSDNANQLLKLIGDILDISKIDAGQMKIAPVTTNINLLQQDIRSSFIASGSIPEGRPVELIVDESEQDPTGEFTFDAARLRQVLSNIIGNALKFTDSGHVKYGYKVTPQGLHFYVEDTGIGIAPEKLKNIGKPFHQLHDASMSAQYGGTGIGLAISMNLVRLMGGKVNVKSELGKGTTFDFNIPCPEIPSSMAGVTQ